VLHQFAPERLPLEAVVTAEVAEGRYLNRSVGKLSRLGNVGLVSVLLASKPGV
jgi:hypothetical protein